jgi:hypothetical protein
MTRPLLLILLPLCACSTTQRSHEVQQSGDLRAEVVWIKDRSHRTGPDYVHVLVRLENRGTHTIALLRDEWLSLSCAGHGAYLDTTASMPGWTLEPGTRREAIFKFRIEEDLPADRTWPVRITIRFATDGRPSPDCVFDIELKNLGYIWAKDNRPK